MCTKAADALPSGKWVVPSEVCIVSKRMENRLTMLNKTYICLRNHGELRRERSDILSLQAGKHRTRP